MSADFWIGVVTGGGALIILLVTTAIANRIWPPKWMDEQTKLMRERNLLDERKIEQLAAIKLIIRGILNKEVSAFKPWMEELEKSHASIHATIKAMEEERP